ncbi:MAG: carbohydrate kinase family protein [Candidatus Adlerbacteria bacterium]|nr:carbohydrate kinase family protein [Candidatus Adlerbacteria bacterium]MDZ4225989.1 carbohydrate kinase family protein [Patescibacteria group bacterium]
MQLDFLAVGDPVVDNFILLKDARVHCKIDNEDCEICMRWGDKIPFESSTEVPGVGNAPNAAVAAARLGLTAAMRAYVGADENGEKCIKALSDEGVDVSLVERVPGKHTNYHFVLWYEGERTILVKHEEFDYQVPALAEAPHWLYLSSLALNSLPYHEALADFLLAHKETKLAFQPGTFQLKMDKEKLARIYKRSDIFFCNKEEAERILNLGAGADIKHLLQQIKTLGPKMVVITDDTRGAYAISEEGSMMHCPRYPDPRPPFEITGAGDALASATTAALALGKPLSEALQWGAVNASAVLQEIGAQKGLLTREQLEKNLATPPGPFAVQSL